MKKLSKYALVSLIFAMILTMAPASLAAERAETPLSELRVSESSPAYGNGLTDAQNLIMQTALAYFYKGEDVQYGSYSLSSGKRNVAQIVRQTNNRSPEESSSQNVHYTVCSAYPHDVYFNALGYHVINHIDAPTWLPRLKQCLDKAYTEYAPGELDDVIGLGNTTVYMTEYAYWLRKNGYEDVVPYFYSNMTDPEGEAYHDPQYTDGTTTDMTHADIQAIIDGLQPGDILVAYKYGDDDAGHAMMAMGKTAYNGKTRQYILHSSGYKYSNTANQYTLVDGEQITGYDRIEAPPAWYNRAIDINLDGENDKPGYDYVLENGGSIRLDVAQDLLGEKASYDINDKFTCFSVIRPLARENVQAMNVTHDGLARLQYPALEITKTSSVAPYNSLRPGEKITFTVELANRTDLGIYVKPTTYADLWVEETIPAGTYCEEAVNGVVSWKNVQVAPGETVSLSYTVTVKDSVKRGQTLVSPYGKVGGNACTDGWFETASFDYAVEGERPVGISGDMTITGKYDGDTAVVSAIYDAAGYTGIALPDVQELMDALCTTKTIKNNGTNSTVKLMLKDPATLSAEASVWADMIVPGYIGGTALHTVDAAGLRSNRNRLLQLSEDFLQVGDILVYADVETNTKNVTDRKVYVYLGNSNFGVYENGEYSVLYAPVQVYVTGGIPYEPSLNKTENYTYKYAYSEVVTKSLERDFFLCLRPSLAYDELPTVWDDFGVLFNEDRTILVRAPETLSGGYRIPQSVRTIASGAFANCTELTGVALPAGLTAIGDDVWSGCEKLKAICFLGEEEDWIGVDVGQGNEILTGDAMCFRYITGDMNNDLQVTDDDAIYLLRCILFPTKYYLEQSGDLNGDGVTSDRDALYLLRYVLFGDKYTLYGK